MTEEKGARERPLAVDLFAGAGGMSEGFVEAGFRVALAVEIDKDCAETYARNHSYRKRYPTEVLCEDIRRINLTEELQTIRVLTRRKRVDVVFGGPPCQGFSRANMQTRNASNPHNGLVSSFVHAVGQMKPHIAVMENVADLEVFEGGEVLAKIKADLAGMGYYAEHSVLTATEFGVPQKRRRLFLIAVRNGGPVAFPRPRLEEKDFVSVRDAISDLPKLANGNKVDERAYRKHSKLTAYQMRMRRRTNGSVRNNMVSENGELVLRRYEHIPQGGNWKDIPPYLMKNYEDKTRCHNNIYYRLEEAEPSVVITHYRKSMLIHPKQDRGLSVREAARIQSFPDHYVFKGSLTSQQQQVANAVPPLLAKAVAKSVKSMLRH